MISEKELREEYIVSLESSKFTSWVIIIVFSLVTLALWIFATELWTLGHKISFTIVGALFIYFKGIVGIKEANKKLEEEEK